MKSSVVKNKPTDNDSPSFERVGEDDLQKMLEVALGLKENMEVEEVFIQRFTRDFQARLIIGDILKEVDNEWTMETLTTVVLERFTQEDLNPPTEKEISKIIESFFK